MSKWAKWAPLCGVAFVGFLVADFALSGNSPDSKATGAKVISYYAAHRGREQGAGFMGMYAVVFLLFFVAAFRAYQRRTRPESGPLAALSFGGGLMVAVGVGILSAAQIALSDVPGSLSPAAAQALNVISSDLYIPLLAAACVFMIANGLVKLRHGVLPHWIGWIPLTIGDRSVPPPGRSGF